MTDSVATAQRVDKTTAICTAVLLVCRVRCFDCPIQAWMKEFVLKIKPTLTLLLGLCLATTLGYRVLTRPAPAPHPQAEWRPLQPIHAVGSSDRDPIGVPAGPIIARSPLDFPGPVVEPERHGNEFARSAIPLPDQSLPNALPLSEPLTNSQSLDEFPALEDPVASRDSVAIGSAIAPSPAGDPDESLPASPDPVQGGQSEVIQGWAATFRGAFEQVADSWQEVQQHDNVEVQGATSEGASDLAQAGSPQTEARPNEPQPDEGLALAVVESLPERKAMPHGWSTNPFAVAGTSGSAPAPPAELEIGQVSRQPVPLRTVPLPIRENQQFQLAQSAESGPGSSVLIATTDGGQTMLEPSDLSKATAFLERGKALFLEGSAAAAQGQLMSAMEVLANAKDRINGGSECLASLRRAWQILEEADDWVVEDVDRPIPTRIAERLENHRSDVVLQSQAASMSAAELISVYLSEAKRELDHACGRSPVSAEILFCLGKLYTAWAGLEDVPTRLPTARAMVFHQTALLSHPDHERSANELGVLLARNGRLEDAKSLFQHSIEIRPHVQSWRNLATVHRRLGETELADLAEAEYRRLSERTAAREMPTVR